MRTDSGTGTRAGAVRPRRSPAAARALFGLLLLLPAVLGGCAATPGTPAAAQRPTVRVAALKGPTAVGMVPLMAAQAAGTTATDDVFTVSASPEEVAAKVASGDVDIAALPTNVAAVLYARTNGAVRLLAVTTLGVLSIVEDGDSVHALSDLRGRTVYATGQGANPEYVLRFLLRSNGLDPDADVHLVFKAQHEELATLVANGTAGLALLPEPFVTTVTMKNPRVRVALDLTREWSATVTDGSRLMMGAVVVRSDFLERHPEEVDAFLREYRASVAQATADVEATARECERFDIIPAAVARAAIPRLNLTFLTGEEMVAGARGYLRVLHDADPASVGGAIPDSRFYVTGR